MFTLLVAVCEFKINGGKMPIDVSLQRYSSLGEWKLLRGSFGGVCKFLEQPIEFPRQLLFAILGSCSMNCN